jgi:hypothetical protein
LCVVNFGDRSDNRFDSKNIVRIEPLEGQYVQHKLVGFVG